MNEVILNLPASPPITEVLIWIGHYASGGEGMLSADLPMPEGLGIRHMPLMNSRRAVAEMARPMAERVKSASQHAPDRIVKIELRTFNMTLGTQSPELAPVVFCPEFERLTKAQLIDIVWSFAAMCSGDESNPELVMATFRRERDAVLTERESPNG